MSWRPILLALLIIGGFAGFSFYYYRLYISPKVHAIIVFVVPGLDMELLSAAGVYDDGRTFHPEIAKTGRVVMVANQTELGKTNPAALLSYFSTGRLGASDQLGLSLAGERQALITHRALRGRRVTGLISSSSPTHPGAAAFYAHIANSRDEPTLVEQLLRYNYFNLILARCPNPSIWKEAGERVSVSEEGGFDLFAGMPEEMTALALDAGYRLVSSKEELEDVPAWRTRQLLGFFDPPMPLRAVPLGELAAVEQVVQEADGVVAEEAIEICDAAPPSLVDMVRRAIQCLQFHINGYFLVVHHPMVGGHAGSITAEEALLKIRELDRALREARRYAGSSSTILLYVPYTLPVVPAVPMRFDASEREARPPFATMPAGFGWAAFYTQPLPELGGFLTPVELHDWLGEQF